jgi:hypothetical protein
MFGRLVSLPSPPDLANLPAHPDIATPPTPTAPKPTTLKNSRRSIIHSQNNPQRYLLPVVATAAVIPAKAGIQFFAVDSCLRRGDIASFAFPQWMLLNNKFPGFFLQLN